MYIFSFSNCVYILSLVYELLNDNETIHFLDPKTVSFLLICIALYCTFQYLCDFIDEKQKRIISSNLNKQRLIRKVIIFTLKSNVWMDKCDSDTILD